MRFPLVVRRLNRTFFSQLEAAQPQTLSLFSTSSTRHLSSAPPDTNSGKANLPHSLRTSYGRIRAGVVQSENPSDEGAYTATLRRSKSQSQVSGKSYASRVVSSACFKCGKKGHWARDCDQPSAAAGVGEVEKCCPCGIGSCLVLTANTERNRGRKFFRCPSGQENGGCGFFEWCDEPSGNTTSAEDSAGKNGSQLQFNQHPTNEITSDFTKSRNEYDNGTNTHSSSYGTYPKFEATDNKGYAMKNSSSCFKCGKEGHWATDCQTSPSSNSTTPCSAGVKGKSSSSHTCYKCGQGHWAKDCSQSITGKP